MNSKRKLCFQAIKETATTCYKQEGMMRHINTKYVPIHVPSKIISHRDCILDKGSLFTAPSGQASPEIPGEQSWAVSLCHQQELSYQRGHFKRSIGWNQLGKEDAIFTSAHLDLEQPTLPIYHPYPKLPFSVHLPDSGSRLQPVNVFT